MWSLLFWERKTMILQIVLTALGSVGFYSFLQFLITRKDNRKDLLNAIIKKLDKAEKDSCRTQLLVLMSDYPEEKKEIYTLAEHYFRDLQGDWYMTSLFRSYIRDQGIDAPIWFADAMKTK